eukprot:gene45873-56145_t
MGTDSTKPVSPTFVTSLRLNGPTATGHLRAMGCTNRIGFFLHIPLPPPLILAAIPAHDWLMRALFAYDLVGFQSEADLTHFTRYIEAEAHAEDLGQGRWRAFSRTMTAGAFPIGIDVDEFTGLTETPELSADDSGSEPAVAAD